MYLKKAQSEKPCLYEIPYDTFDIANRFTPDREETLNLEKESRSKLDKDLVKPYDYTKQNSLYENFKPASKEYHDQLAHANEVRKKMRRKSFVKLNQEFSKTSHSHDHFGAPTAHDMEILIKTCLMPLALKTQNDSFTFVHELKKEMHADLKYVELLKKETDELESDKAEFSNMYDLLLQECKSAPFSDSLDRKSFSKTKSIPKTNMSKSLSKLVTIQILPQTARQDVRNTNVIKARMYQIDTRTTQSRASQLPQTFRNTNPRVSTSRGVIHRTNVSRPPLRSTQIKDKVVPNNSQVKNKKIEVEDHLRISSIFKTKEPNVVPISTRKPKSHANKFVATLPKKTVASESTIQNSKSYYRMLYEKTSNGWKWWIEQQCPSGYKWIVQLILFIVDSGCTKHMTSNLKLLCNVVEKYLVPFILAMINLLQLLVMDLEVAFRKSTCFVRDLQGNDLLTGTEFLNKTLNAFFKEEGIEHQTSTPPTPEHNGIVERRNCTLVEAARMMLSASKLPLFFWAEAIATACYTQNRSIIIPSHEKTAYHVINDRKPSIRHLHIFGCTCYLTRDGENLDKIKEKGDLCILVGYSTQFKGYRVYNKRTRLIVESIHLRFDEIKEMAKTSVDNNTSGLVPQQHKVSDYDNFGLTPQLQNVSPLANTTAPSQQDLDLLFDPLYDEFFTVGTSGVNKSSSPTDNFTQQDTPPTLNVQSSTAPTTPTNVHVEENNTSNRYVGK
ncbi:retrovirus-related pol polyprotein from transposon TNT 1-94 [Tanacetum coccineum]|uniref:Retrovirus-related pol polyprotein from transposon TNT 1-94 n=1 Tax=Tanacetum coccineum TaxID=301880 RepID=A0ABQ5HEA4_9ASTR